MTRLAILVLVAGCTGVSSHSWDNTVETFASTHCAWNQTCDQRDNAVCESETKGLMTSARTRLDADAQERCLDCMEAWIVAYQAATSPCSHVLRGSDYEAIHAACDTSTEFDGWQTCASYDLPGSSPWLN